MATLPPWIGTKFYLADGVTPNSGGKIFTYEPGTTTKKPTLQSESGAYNTNPIICNSAGEVNMWLLPGGYKVVNAPANDTDPPASAIKTWDDINVDGTGGEGQGFVASIADLRGLDEGAFSTVQVVGYNGYGSPGGGLFYWDSTNSAADNGGTIIAPTVSSGTGRWIRVLSNENEVNVSYFGAGDISPATDTDALVAAYGSFGGDPGTIVIDVVLDLVSSVTIPDNISIVIPKGGLFDVPVGQVLTMSEPEAGDYQIFSGLGTKTLSKATCANVLWWGALGDATTDDKLAFDAAAASAYASGAVLCIPRRIYSLSSWNLNALSNGLVIQGGGAFTQLKFGSGSGYGFRIAGGCRKIIIRDLNLNFPNAADEDCFQLGMGGAGANQAYECAFYNLAITGNSGSPLQRGLVVEQSYIHQFYNCQILSFGYNVVFKEEGNSCNFYGCSIRANPSNNVVLIDAQSGQQNTFFGGDIENCKSWVKNTGTEGLEFVGVYFEASNDVAIRLEAGYTKFDKCFLSEGRAYIYEGGRSSFRDNRVRKTGTSYFVYFIHYSKLTFDAAGYTSFVAGDIGRTIAGGAGSAKIVAYDNATRIVTCIPTADFTNGDACTTTGGTGAGTLAAAGGYTQDTPMDTPMFTAESNRMEFTTPGSTTTGLFTRGFTTGLQSWKWDASGPTTATLSNFCNINQERIFDANTATLKTLNITNSDGLRLNGPVDANVGDSRMKTLSLTQTTGTRPLSISSTTKVDNLNADLLDGLDSIDFARRSGFSSSPSVVSGNWYRIASNGTVAVAGTGGNRASALFTIKDGTGGRNTEFSFYASINFGANPTITMINQSPYTARLIEKIRIVYSNSVGTAEGAAVEIQANATLTAAIKFSIYDNDASTGWTAEDFTAGSVPAGTYTTVELDISNAPVMGVSVGGANNVFQLDRNGRLVGRQVPTATLPAQRHSAIYKIALVNLNSAATDTGTFVGLPTKYRIVRLTGYDASTSLTTATFDLRTAAAGAGTALVSAFAPTALTGSAKIVDATLAAAATTDYQTAGTLYLRNVTAQGGAATASFILEVEDLT